MMLHLLVALAFALDPAPLDRVLTAHVSAGRVDYAAVPDAELAAWLADAAKATGPQSKAFWINAYNATVLHALASGPLPAKVTDIPGFFDAKTHVVAGETLTLNALEGKIRAWGDPRIHFALNCGARSCPPLPSRAFPEDPAALDALLEKLTADFLAGPGLVIDDAKHLFDWYRADFGDAVAFVRKHLADPAEKAKLDAAVAAGYAVTYQPYDWTPNAR